MTTLPENERSMCVPRGWIHLTLFTSRERRRVAAEPSLRLVERLSNPSPLYLIDLNVMFDVVRRRVNESSAGRVIRAGFQNLVRLAVAEEFIKELTRAGAAISDDPVLRLAKQLPVLPEPPKETVDKLGKVLAPVLFPQRSGANQLKEREISDLKHLITAIHHGVDGFITSDKAVLRTRQWLLRRQALDVIGVMEFSNVEDRSNNLTTRQLVASWAGHGVRIRALEKTASEQSHTFLLDQNVPAPTAADALAEQESGRQRHRLIATSGITIVGFASWDVIGRGNKVSVIFVCVDEEYPAADLVADHLINRACIG